MIGICSLPGSLLTLLGWLTKASVVVTSCKQKTPIQAREEVKKGRCLPMVMQDICVADGRLMEDDCDIVMDFDVLSSDQPITEVQGLINHDSYGRLS